MKVIPFRSHLGSLLLLLLAHHRWRRGALVLVLLRGRYLAGWLRGRAWWARRIDRCGFSLRLLQCHALRATLTLIALERQLAILLAVPAPLRACLCVRRDLPRCHIIIRYYEEQEPSDSSKVVQAHRLTLHSFRPRRRPRCSNALACKLRHATTAVSRGGLVQAPPAAAAASPPRSVAFDCHWLGRAGGAARRAVSISLHTHTRAKTGTHHS